LRKLHLRKKTIDKLPGYELRIRDRNLTIQDFLCEVNDFFENAELPRLWPQGNHNCYGCDLCCHEPLPVSSIDVEQICQATGSIFSQAFKYLWVETQGNIIDITLRRRRDGSCIFLRKDSTCSIYQYRPFLCQTYICCQTSPEMEEVRSTIVNQGMDELVRKSLLLFNSRGLELPVNKGNKKYIKIGDWKKNKFSGKSSYSDILIKDILPSDLMRHLLL